VLYIEVRFPSKSEMETFLVPFVHASLSVVALAGRGLGVVCTVALPAGVVILRERAAAMVSPCDDVPPGRNGVALLLAERLVDALGSDAALCAAVAELEGYNTIAPTLNAELDAFRAASEVCKHNAYGVHDRDGDLHGEGLWVFGARFNHACAPNALWDIVGNLLVVRTACDVAKGVELCVSYGPGHPLDPYARSEVLQGTWGFRCDASCSLCTEQRGGAGSVACSTAAGEAAAVHAPV
jgi:hypothetical protein